uniref:Uncharacterized protein n=1 Tax=Sphaerodactylus townsendi TaxID=933632 RepID=A0ACB8G8W3_9SAUR
MKVLVLAVALLFLVSAVSAGCKDYCEYTMCTDDPKGCDKGYYPRESCHCSSLKKPKRVLQINTRKGQRS